MALRCPKCRFDISDMSDGCSKCKKFKDELLFFDDEKTGDDSIPWELNETRKLVRNELVHLTKVRGLKREKDPQYYDEGLIQSMQRLVKMQADVCRMLRHIQSDARRLMEEMTAEDRVKFLIIHIRSMPENVRKQILLLASVEGKENEVFTLTEFVDRTA